MQTVLRGFRKGLVPAFAIVVVMSIVYWPQASLPVVIWLLGVALLWRSSPGSEG
ncbi:MAG: hypothetical protein WD672_06280 [Woeseia sp.]